MPRIAIPHEEDSLAEVVGRTHFRYSQYINRLHERNGHLWQGRFYSCALDEPHLWLAMKYIELNPVRARLCRRPWRYAWSSAVAHVAGRDGALVRVAPLLERVEDWRQFLTEALTVEDAELLRRHERTGRTLGEAVFLERVEEMLGRVVRPARPGRKRKRQRK
jgi:putative transposase